MRRQRPKASSGPGAQPPVTAASLLAEAETLQQRAERRKGQEAVPVFQEAAAKYQQVLDWAAPGAPSTEERQTALFGLAECCQLWADTLLQVARTAPDDQLTPAAEAAAASTAAGLYQQAVQAYCQVCDPAPAGPMRADAAVNCGNALCSWAELGGVEPAAAAQLLLQAVEAYQTALQQEGEADAATYSNLGDAYVQQGELASRVGEPQLAAQCFQAALRAYETSCSLSDSAAGDDLPGLLHNWGCGLHAISQHTQDPAAKQQLLEQAAQKLRNCLDFTRGDVAPANALGDVLCDAAELLLKQQEQTAGGTPSAATINAAAGLYRQAQEDGYQAALTIRRAEPDALVGLAEVQAALGRLAGQAGDAAAGRSHLAQAVAHYDRALAAPHLLGNFRERQDVRYNYACAAALAGEPDKAVQVLVQLVAVGAVTAEDVAADGDLAPLLGHPALQQQQAG